MEDLKIIARFQDGKLVKGTTNNFMPTSMTFHVLPHDAEDGDKPTLVPVNRLKAVFIVHDFDGREGSFRPNANNPNAQPPCGRTMKVIFDDGESLEGVSMNYDPVGLGFFLVPRDPYSNNKRIFVINESVKDVQFT